MDAMRSKMFFLFQKYLKFIATPTTIFGFLNHSMNSQTIILHHDHWNSGSNLVMSYLLFYLVEYWKAGNFPSILYLQVDNSWKESKNKIIFTTLAWLIHIGCFEEVQLHCLIQEYHVLILIKYFSIACIF